MIKKVYKYVVFIALCVCLSFSCTLKHERLGKGTGKDLYYKTEHLHFKPSKEKGKDEILNEFETRTYLKGNWSRTEKYFPKQSEQIEIWRPDLKKRFILLPDSQVFYQKDITAAQSVPIKVEILNDKTIIEGCTSKHYRVISANELPMDIWGTEDFDPGESYKEKIEFGMANLTDEMKNELKKIKGFRIQTVVQLKDGTIIMSTVKEAEKKALSSSLFEVPEDYKEIEPPAE